MSDRFGIITTAALRQALGAAVAEFASDTGCLPSGITAHRGRVTIDAAKIEEAFFLYMIDALPLAPVDTLKSRPVGTVCGGGDDDRAGHGGWRQGVFFDLPEYRHMSPAWKTERQAEEACLVRPSSMGNAICRASTPADAILIARRLNAAAKAERELVELRAEIGTLKTVRGGKVGVSDFCRPEVLRFAVLMERELRANDHKGKQGWKGDAPGELAARVLDEAIELDDAVRVRPVDPARIASEAADLANMAMMVVDQVGGLPPLTVEAAS